MNLRRIFANAIARRAAYVLVAAALAWCGLGDARAQTYQCSAVQDNTCNREQAYTEAVARRNELMAIYTTAEFRIVDGMAQSNPVARYQVQYRWGSGSWTNPESPILFYWTTECPSGYWWDDVNKTCGQPCADKPPIPAGAAHAPGDTQAFCQDGCAYSCSGMSMLVTIDGQLLTVCAGQWQTSGGATCSAGEPPPLTPVVDTDGDGISDENDLSPNNPGESGDGSGQDVSRACGGPGQPECLPDGSNEGSGRGNTSGGGGDCNTPPRSSGDAILAQIAFQTWATRCAVLGTANQGSGTGTGTGDGESALDQLRAEAAGLDTSLGEGDAEAAWIEGPSSLDLDTGGLGIGGTCPAPPTVNGVSIDPDGNLCMLVQIIGTLVLVGAFAHAGYIIGRA